MVALTYQFRSKVRPAVCLREDDTTPESESLFAMALDASRCHRSSCYQSVTATEAYVTAADVNGKSGIVLGLGSELTQNRGVSN
jgi:hypothetical protein